MRLVFLLVLAGLIAIFVFVKDIHTLDLVGNFAQWGALLLAAISLTRGANLLEHGSVSRKAWIRIAIGVWIWLGGETMISYSELVLRQIAYGTVADAFWLLGYLIMFSGLILLVLDLRREEIHLNARSAGLLLIIVAGVIVFLPFLWVLIRDSERALAWRLLDLTYPALAWTMAGIGWFLFLKWRALGKLNLAGTCLLFCISFVLIVVSDLLFSYHTDFDSYVYRLVDLGYFVAYSLFVFVGDRLVSQREI